MHYLKFYITPEDIFNKLSEEDKEKFNKIVPVDVRKGEDGCVEMTYLLFKDGGEAIPMPSNQPRYSYYSDTIKLSD